MLNNMTKISIGDELCQFQVHIISWNVGKHFPDNISLREILDLQCRQEKNVDGHHFPDVYAIGLQEINTQPTQQILGIFKEDPWIAKIKDFLSSLDYVLIKSEQMQGIQLSIFIRRIHIPNLREIEGIYIRTGFGGIWGNKGAVGIRFTFYGCALVFINSHLAAHDDRLNERIDHYQQIMKNHRFSIEKYHKIYDHDYVFWFGDLNFRLSGEGSSTEVHEQLKNDDKFLDLFKDDQLTLVREITQEAFHGLQESEVNFKPTFKYKDGTSEYDLKRRPAWTDRILYGIQPSKEEPIKSLHIKQCTYTSHSTYCISDHKPVSGLFQIKFSHALYEHFPIKFNDIIMWSIGKEHAVKYSTPSNFKRGNHDWIGLFCRNYNSFSDYITYEYVNQTLTSPEVNIDSYLLSYEQIQQQHSVVADSYAYILNFAENIHLKNDEEYVLIYFQSSGSHGVTSILGMSNAFRAENNTSLRRNFVNID